MVIVSQNKKTLNFALVMEASVNILYDVAYPRPFRISSFKQVA